MIIVLAVLVAPAMGAMSAAMNARDLTGTNMAGIDHWNTFVTSAQECADLCDTTAGCAGATYVLPNTIQGANGHCWRKSAVTGDTENFNCISFTKLAVVPVAGCVMSNPSADFSYQGDWDNHGSGSAPLTIQFTDLSTGAMAWAWDFGDGSPISHEKNPSHTYTMGSPDGTIYSVTHRVLGSCAGLSASDIDTVTRSNIIRIFDKVGFLTLASTPGGAAVIVDGMSLGITSTTASEWLPLAPGSHTVRLTLDGYRDYSANVTIVNGVLTPIAPVLEKTTSDIDVPPSATGSLQITTAPGGAAVSVDGTPKGATPLNVPGLGAGSHTVTLTKAGYTDYQGTLTLSAGKTTLLNITLVAAPITTTTTPTSPQVPSETTSLPATQAPSGTGNLTVQSTPAGANVYLDGEKMGTTPVRVPGVAPGTHRLLLTLQGYNDISQPVEITGGTENEVNTSFLSKKTPGFAAPASLAAIAFSALLMVRRKKD